MASPRAAEGHYTPVASGFIAGEAMMAVLVALLVPVLQALGIWRG